MEPPGIFCFSSAAELISSGEEFDLLFLDIEMPGTEGIQVKEYYERQGKHTRIIFTTSHEEKVLEKGKKVKISRG